MSSRKPSRTSTSGTVSGGDRTAADGFARDITTADGLIIAPFQSSTTMSTRIGEGTTTTGIGTDAAGNSGASLTQSCSTTGDNGTIAATGTTTATGASTATHLDLVMNGR